MVVQDPFPREDPVDLQASKVEVRPKVDSRTAFDQLKPKCIIVEVGSVPEDVWLRRQAVWPW